MPPMGEGFGDELGDIGEPGADDTGMEGGEEASTPLAESQSKYVDRYLKMLRKNTEEVRNERVAILDKNFLINEELNSAIKDLEMLEEERKKNEKELL